MICSLSRRQFWTLVAAVFTFGVDVGYGAGLLVWVIWGRR